MADKEIRERIEQLCEELVFVETSDHQALADLHTHLEEIGQWAVETSQPEVAAAAAAAAKVIENVILEEMPEPEASLEVVGHAASAIRAIIRDGRSVEEVRFPEELGLAENLPNSAGDDTSASSAGFSRRSLLSTHVDEAIVTDFLVRQAEVLEEMEALTLALGDSDDKIEVATLRGLIHTLKGEAGLLGLADVQRLCHAAEDALGGNTPKTLVDILLEVKDWLGRAFDAYSGEGLPPEPVEKVLTLLAALQAPREDETRVDAPAETEPEKETITEPNRLNGDLVLLGDFVSESTEHLEAADVHLLALETEPKGEEALNAVFRAFHTIKGVAGFLALDEIGSLAHEAENLFDRARKGELALVGRSIDVAFDTVDTMRRLVNSLRDSLATGRPLVKDESLPQLLARVKAVASGEVEDDQLESAASDTAQGKRLGQIMVEAGTATQESVDAALSKQQEAADGPKLGELLVRDAHVPAKDVAHALRAQKAQKPASLQQLGTQVRETVKVEAERLDRLLDAIGELVIAESMASQSLEIRKIVSPRLARQMNRLEKITRELQEMGTSLRMVPVRATFQKMARLVRDLAKKAGKQVGFVMSGENTELDKTVVERIGDPLVHIIRNAVDHGLEASPQERHRTGKPETGRIELRAFHKGGNIYIEVEDDGRGLDRKAILAKARGRGMVHDGDSMSDREVFNLIFEPGLSTATTVTDVSGRGVGMDVVKRNIEAIRGHVEIHSQAGKGSIITIALPLTLAIIDGMVVRVGTERYIIPTLSVVRSIRPERKDLSTVLKRGEMLSLQGRLIPLFRLGCLFGIEGAEVDPIRALVVVVEDDGHQTGLLIDELLGQHQVVIKTLGEAMRGIPGISGGAIMPDGHVGLILDVGGLVKLASSNGNAQRAQA